MDMRPNRSQTRCFDQQSYLPRSRFRNNFERPPHHPPANTNTNFRRNVQAIEYIAYSRNYSNQPFTRPMINIPTYPPSELYNYQANQFQPTEQNALPNSFSNAPVTTEPDSQSIINNWLSANTSTDQQDRKLHQPFSIKVSDVSENLQMCYKNVVEIEQYIQYLESNTVDEEEWKEILKCISQKKELIEMCQKAIDLKGKDLQKFTNILRKRKAKRKRLKNVKQKKLKEVPTYFLDTEMELIEKEKQKIEMKKQAMVLLTSVKKKVMESRRQIKLLSAMIKLHDARNMNVARKTGDGFKIIISKLIKMWEDQLKESKLEETGLKVMLQDEPWESGKQKGSNLKWKYERWLRALFGITNDRSHIFYSNGREFVDIRFQWDKYVTQENTTTSSKIPIGWVLPNEQASESWQKYLCGDNY